MEENNKNWGVGGILFIEQHFFIQSHTNPFSFIYFQSVGSLIEWEKRSKICNYISIKLATTN